MGLGAWAVPGCCSSICISRVYDFVEGGRGGPSGHIYMYFQLFFGFVLKIPRSGLCYTGPLEITFENVWLDWFYLYLM